MISITILTTESTVKTLKKGMMFYPKKVSATLCADILEELLSPCAPENWKEMSMEDLDEKMRKDHPDAERLVVSRLSLLDELEESPDLIMLLNPEVISITGKNPDAILFTGTTWNCIRLIEGLHKERRVYVYYFSEREVPIEEEICLYDGTNPEGR